MIPFWLLYLVAVLPVAVPYCVFRLHRPAKERGGRWVEVQGKDRLWQAVAEGRAVELVRR